MVFSKRLLILWSLDFQGNEMDNLDFPWDFHSHFFYEMDINIL